MASLCCCAIRNCSFTHLLLDHNVPVQREITLYDFLFLSYGTDGRTRVQCIIKLLVTPRGRALSTVISSWTTWRAEQNNLEWHPTLGQTVPFTRQLYKPNLKNNRPPGDCFQHLWFDIFDIVRSTNCYEWMNLGLWHSIHRDAYPQRPH